MSAILDLDPVMRFAAHDQLALEALINDGRAGEIAFRQWIDTVDIETMPSGSTQLLPLIFMRHVQGNPHLPHYPRIKGVHRLAHVRNSLLLDAARLAAGALAEAGIGVMLIKGAALALTHYQRPELRPMGDVDLLVTAADYDRARGILQERGWRYRYGEAHRQQVRHSCDYITHDGRALDLHLRALLEVNDPAFEDGIFARARRVQWSGLEILVPSAEDEALICLVHAMRDIEAARPLWVMDLAQLAKNEPALDWQALWQRANRFGVAREVMHATQIAGHLRGNEPLHAILAREIATTPRFEGEYLDTIVSTGSTYAIPEGRRAAVDRSLSSGRAAAGDGRAMSWSALTEAPSAFGTVRVFETDGSAIKALHLRWRHLALVPALFAVMDPDKWDEICRNAPATGEGTLDLRPGLLQRRADAMPPHVYHATITAASPLPHSLRRAERIRIPVVVANRSAGPWYATGKAPYATALSWHVHTPAGDLVRWDNERLQLLPPVMKAHHLSFVAPGAEITCLLDFTAPETPGVYRITFDLVQEGVRWFSDPPETVPHRSSFTLAQKAAHWFSAAFRPAPAPGWQLTVV